MTRRNENILEMKESSYGIYNYIKAFLTMDNGEDVWTMEYKDLDIVTLKTKAQMNTACAKITKRWPLETNNKTRARYVGQMKNM